MQVRNRISECDDGKPHSRALKDVDKVVVHRIEREEGLDAASISLAFRNTAKFQAGSYTGGEMPYAFVICEDGSVDQALELSDVGPHVRKYNLSAIGIAVIGDFRYDPPKAAQYLNLVELTAALLRWLAQPVRSLYGHDELPGASVDVHKKCPGSYLDMNVLRLDVQQLMSRQGFEALKTMGVVF